MTIWRMRIACWITKATYTHSEYALIHIAFPLQQWLHTYFVPPVLLILRHSEFWGRSQANTWEIRGRQSVLGQVSVRVLRLSPYQYHPTRLLALSQYSEGPATGHLDTGFSWFPCVYKQMLRWFPRPQVATTCFSRSPPDLNLPVTSFIFCMHVK